MKIYLKNNKAFTLIELLVVVAIISLLSSIVMTSLNSARFKARDAAVKEGVSQFANLMAFNFDDYGTYCNLATYWISASSASCDAVFSGNYVTQARAICKNIYDNAGDIWTPSGGYKFYSQSSAGCSNSYSITVPLNNNKWYCSGSSGRKGEYANYTGQPGCYNNP